MTFTVADDCTSITLISDEFADLALPGAYAMDVLTITGEISDGETVVINGKTYTLQETLTNVDGNVHIEGDEYATGLLQIVGQPGDGETITIDGKTYTFQTILTNVDGNVFIGLTTDATMENLVAAINLDAGAGTKYAAATTEHATFEAALGVGPNIDVTYKLPGTIGNGKSLTDTVGGWSWAAATSSGGTNDIANTLLNLRAALGLGSGAGTDYAAATTAHTTVSSSHVITATTLGVKSDLIGVVGNGYTATETLANGEWATPTFTGGIDVPVYSHIDVVATDPDGEETTVNIEVGDLTDGDYVIDDDYFGNSTWAPNMYKFTLNSTLPTEIENIDTGCVLVDCELQCEVWDKVKDNITSNDCKRTEFHLVYESLLNTNGCSTCSCDIALELYTQLKEDVTTITYNSDCGC